MNWPKPDYIPQDEWDAIVKDFQELREGSNVLFGPAFTGHGLNERTAVIAEWLGRRTALFAPDRIAALFPKPEPSAETVRSVSTEPVVEDEPNPHEDNRSMRSKRRSSK